MFRPQIRRSKGEMAVINGCLGAPVLCWCAVFNPAIFPEESWAIRIFMLLVACGAFLNGMYEAYRLAEREKTGGSAPSDSSHITHNP